MIIGVIVGFVVLMIVLSVVIEKNTVRGTCPRCSAQVGLMRGIGACRTCGEALRSSNNQLIPVEPGYVPDNPSFTVTLAQLKHPTQWKVIWPGRCCVCGRPASQQKTIKVKTIVGQAGPLFTPMNLTDSATYPLGYCGGHSDGMRYAYPPGFGNAKSNEQCLLAIKSVDYFREFMQANGIQAGRQVA